LHRGRQIPEHFLGNDDSCFGFCPGKQARDFPVDPAVKVEVGKARNKNKNKKRKLRANKNYNKRKKKRVLVSALMVYLTVKRK
jgi:hypothetical protein